MTHAWASNVISGVEQPRILIVGPELISNPGFEENTTNWSESGTSVISRVANTTTIFGDYVLQVEDDNAAGYEYAYQTINYGAAVGGKKYILSAYVKSGSSNNQRFSMDFTVNTDDPSTFTARDYWKKFVLEVTMPTSAATTFDVQFYPCEYGDVSETGIILVDHVSVREVLYDIQLPLPYRGDFKHGFIPLLQAGHKLSNGVNKKFYKGLIYYYSAWWQKLSYTEESNRQRIIMENQINGRDLIIFPHRDADRAYLVSCENSKLETSWMAGVALGHEGGMELIGQELYQMAPTDVVTSSYYDDLIVSDEFVVS